MLERSQIVDTILAGLESVSQELEPGHRFTVHDQLTLFGPASALDSLGLVSLALEVELMLSERHGVEIRLTDERAMSRERSPFRTVQTLADYIAELVRESG